jgi:RNA polymerase sigma-70 factor (ECF subfamily)
VDEPRRQPAPTALVSAAAAGDTDAFARIMSAHDGDMTRLAMVICGDVDMAREAVQAAWLIAWRRIGSLRDPTLLRSWLMSIAANEARQNLRSTRRRTLHEARAKPGVQPPGPQDHAEQIDLAVALARLHPDDRRLIGMRYLIGLTSVEIAAELKRTPSSVRGRLARLTDRLRRELSDD